MNSTTLNAMFKRKSNTTCNNILFSRAKIEFMHESMKRLYAVARATKDIVGQTSLANALNTSPQRVKNWEERGVSKEGLLAAERLFGCSPTFIETGRYPPSIGQQSFMASEPHPVIRDQNVSDLIAAAERLSPADAKMLLPVVSRIAEANQPRRKARQNSNNSPMFKSSGNDKNATGT